MAGLLFGQFTDSVVGWRLPLHGFLMYSCRFHASANWPLDSGFQGETKI